MIVSVLLAAGKLISATKNRRYRRGRRICFQPQRTGDTGEVREFVISHKEQ
jgi:hypothetical protein